MIDILVAIDHFLFNLINSSCANSFFDVLMPLLRNKFFWAPLYGFIAFFIIYNFTGKSFKIILFAIVTIVLSDQLSSTIIKPLVKRLRPCQEAQLNNNMPNMRQLVGCGSGYSFPSSHAANHFAFAIFFAILFRNKWLLFGGLLWAAIISFAQIYVGVHYPLDILGGAVLGILIGLLTSKYCLKYLNKIEG